MMKMNNFKWTLSKKISKTLICPIYRLLAKPSVRYSTCFSEIRNILRYSPLEELLENSMNFAKRSALDGDYLEFGVACHQRASFVSAFHLAQKCGLKTMKFFAFDSFKGLPRLEGIDDDGFFCEGQYASSLNDFKHLISKNGVDLDKVTIVDGWYKDTLNEEAKKKLAIKSAAVILIDCDLYASAVPVLDFVKDYLVNGTILIFDDWFCFKGNIHRGVQKAFRQWLEKNPKIKATEFRKYGCYGNSFIITIS